MVKALLLAATFGIDWTQDIDVVSKHPAFHRCGNTVVAEYGCAYDRDNAKRKLEALERAA